VVPQTSLTTACRGYASFRFVVSEGAPRAGCLIRPRYGCHASSSLRRARPPVRSPRAVPRVVRRTCPWPVARSRTERGRQAALPRRARRARGDPPAGHRSGSACGAGTGRPSRRGRRHARPSPVARWCRPGASARGLPPAARRSRAASPLSRSAGCRPPRRAAGRAPGPGRGEEVPFDQTLRHQPSHRPGQPLAGPAGRGRPPRAPGRPPAAPLDRAPANLDRPAGFPGRRCACRCGCGRG